MKGFGPFRRQQYTQRLGAVIHSHPKDLLPSPQDLYPLFTGNADMLAAASVVVVTPIMTTVVVRGKETPQFSGTEIEKKIALWNKLVEERMRRFLKPGDAIHNFEVSVKAQRALMRDIANKYGLVFFQRENDSKVVVRKPSDKLQ